MRLGGRETFIRTQILAPEPRNPHVPVPVQMQLHIPHLERIRVAVFRHLARGVDHVLDEIIRDLQQRFLDVVVHRLCRVDLVEEVLEFTFRDHIADRGGG